MAGTYGLAWREELAYGSRDPRSIELAAWLATGMRGLPLARPYCPAIFVGRWAQTEPVFTPIPHWEFMPDGTFVCDAPILCSREAWRVYRQGDDGPAGDALWLDDDLRIAPEILEIDALTTTELLPHTTAWVYPLPGVPSEYKLVRL